MSSCYGKKLTWKKSSARRTVTTSRESGVGSSRRATSSLKRKKYHGGAGFSSSTNTQSSQGVAAGPAERRFVRILIPFETNFKQKEVSCFFLGGGDTYFYFLPFPAFYRAKGAAQLMAGLHHFWRAWEITIFQLQLRLILPSVFLIRV